MSKSICLEEDGRYIAHRESGEPEEDCVYAKLVGAGTRGRY